MATGLSKANSRQANNKTRQGKFQQYLQNRKTEVNKARRLAAYLKGSPWDRFAHESLEKLGAIIHDKAGVTVPKLAETTKQWCAKNKITRTQYRKNLEQARKQRVYEKHLKEFDDFMDITTDVNLVTQYNN